MTMSNKPLLSESEQAIALAELELAGYLEYDGDEDFRLTTEGLVYGLKKLQSLEPKDRLAILLFCLWNEEQNIRKEG